MVSNNAPVPSAGDNVLDRASRLSRYVSRLLAAEPELPARVDFARAWTGTAMRQRLGSLLSAGDTLERALRRLRKEIMLTLIARDLGGLADLAEVLATTTALAETAIEAAVAGAHAALVEQYGRPRGAADGLPQALHVVGMGKLGEIGRAHV